MTKAVDFYFDFGSPASYLAWTQLPKICEKNSAKLNLKPVLLGGIFKTTGNRPPIAVPAKGQYMLRDLARYTERYQIPFTFNKNFPINTISLMRITTGIQMTEPERLMKVVELFFKGLWVDDLDMGNNDVVAEQLKAAQFDPEKILALATDPKMKEQLMNNTSAAVSRGVFGAPSMFIGSEHYFGQDRLFMVEEHLEKM